VPETVEKLPVLLESGDIVYETGISATYVRVLVQKGVLKPSYRTPRGTRLYDPVTSIADVKRWLARTRPPKKG
jgi:DNA-binding transcriptional MerR regulator